MRVLFVHERFGALAGAESNIQHTAVELKQRGYAVGILHGAGTGQAEAAWREIFSDRFALAAQNRVDSVRAALREFRPELIYVHKLADLEVLEALLAAEVPAIRMMHDHDVCCMRSYKYHFFSRKICRRPVSAFCLFPCGAFIARDHNGRLPVKWVSYAAKKREIQINQGFHRLVVATDYMKEELLRNGFSAEKIEIHAPVPPMGDQPAQSTFSERNLIVYAGQVIRGKGVDVLLESLARVRVPFECLILGDGSQRAFCEGLSRRLGLDDRVRFMGFIPQQEVKSYFLEATAMVLGSVWPEPFGAAGLEGMRYGLPVVAFDAGGIREWLIDGYNGFLVPWMDRACFAARVEELLRHKNLARYMGSRGFQMVTHQYGFSQYISDLEDMFGRLVAKPSEPVHV